MTMTVGDFIVERLHQWAVRRLFGYPGDGINGVFGALARAKAKWSSSKPGTRRWPLSWRRPMQNSLAISEFV